MPHLNLNWLWWLDGLCFLDGWKQAGTNMIIKLSKQVMVVPNQQFPVIHIVGILIPKTY